MGNLWQKELSWGERRGGKSAGESLLCGGGGGSKVLSWPMEVYEEGRRVISCGLEVRAWVGFSKQKQRLPAGSKSEKVS